MTDLSFKTSMEFAYGEAMEMAPGVLRVVANNAGPLTFKGTNTYLLGERAVAVIDPGPNDERHLASLIAAVNGRPISHIFITHAHRDHVDGAKLLRDMTGAPIYAFPRAAEEHAPWQTNPTGKSFINMEIKPDHALADGDTIEGDGWALKAIHTPGHAPDHVCFADDTRRVVFSGDHVMAWNTSVVAPPEGRMADYLASLEKLLDRDDELFLPGHGGRLAEPKRTVKAYLLHRRMREQAIAAAVREGAPNVRALVPIIYGELKGPTATAAALSVQAHVEHLIEKDVLKCGDGAVSLDAELAAA